MVTPIPLSHYYHQHLPSPFPSLYTHPLSTCQHTSTPCLRPAQPPIPTPIPILHATPRHAPPRHATIGAAVRKCGERLFRHVETSQGTKDVTNQFVTYCKVKGITVPKDPKGDYAFKQFVKREFEAASKSLGAPSLRTADRNPVGSLAFLVACAAGFDKDSVVDHQLKEGPAGKPVMPLLLVDPMAFTNFACFGYTSALRTSTGRSPMRRSPSKS
ncbi:hypothetical protein V8C86DRAFT_797002 [Haematococcus lacustris]